MRGTIADLSNPYSWFESWAYDTFAAPAVVDSVEIVRRALGDQIVDRLPRGARVLDVGCGGGQNVTAVAQLRDDLQVEGVDLSPEQIARARRRTRRFGERVALRVGNALSLPFADDHFDLVTSVASIKHWPDKVAGAREACRVLKPGCDLLIVEADRGATFADTARFVDAFRLPRPVRRVMLPLFRTYIAGRSLDLDEAREIATHLDLEDLQVARLPGVPALAISGRKRP